MKEENEILRNVIKEMLIPIKGIPLNLVIESISGKKVFKYSKNYHSELTKTLSIALNEILSDTKNNPIKSKRINEVGNKIEQIIEKKLKEFQLNVEKPTTIKGNFKSTGYPDLKLSHNNEDFYIECKIFSKNSIDSSFRSFYLSPSKDFKITSNGYHFIIAFEIETNQNLSNATSWKILDTYNLLCDVKYEFNSNNKRIYTDCELIAESKNCKD